MSTYRAVGLAKCIVHGWPPLVAGVSAATPRRRWIRMLESAVVWPPTSLTNSTSPEAATTTSTSGCRGSRPGGGDRRRPWVTEGVGGAGLARNPYVSTVVPPAPTAGQPRLVRARLETLACPRELGRGSQRAAGQRCNVGREARRRGAALKCYSRVRTRRARRRECRRRERPHVPAAPAGRASRGSRPVPAGPFSTARWLKVDASHRDRELPLPAATCPAGAARTTRSRPPPKTAGQAGSRP